MEKLLADTHVGPSWAFDLIADLRTLINEVKEREGQIAELEQKIRWLTPTPEVTAAVHRSLTLSEPRVGHLAYLDKLLLRIKHLEEALRFYAAGDGGYDKGERARKVLS